MNFNESYHLSTVRLPAGLVQTKYPGYFWDTMNEKLYSIKVAGVLKELKHHKSFRPPGGRREFPAGFGVSVRGRKFRLTRWELKKLYPTPQLIPMFR